LALCDESCLCLPLLARAKQCPNLDSVAANWRL
jgi:hypothetical protein